MLPADHATCLITLYFEWRVLHSQVDPFSSFDVGDNSFGKGRQPPSAAPARARTVASMDLDPSYVYCTWSQVPQKRSGLCILIIRMSLTMLQVLAAV